MPKPLKPLTQKQQKLYEFIIDFTVEHGYQPTFREMKDHMETDQNNCITQYLNSIERKGLLQVRYNQQRSLHVPEIIEILKRGRDASDDSP